MAAFRSSLWDPTLIIAQIVCMQSIFYATYCFTIFLAQQIGFSSSISAHLTMDLVFPLQSARLVAIAECAATILVAIGLRFVVERAKLCLDFSATVFFWHTVFVLFYNRALPTQISWWLLQILGTVAATVLGEYLCMRAESREIPLTVPPKFQL